MRDVSTCAHRKLLGVLRRPPRGDARDADRRRPRLHHRRLSRRADHAHSGSRPGQVRRPRLRQDLPHPTRGVPWHRARSGCANRRERGRAESGGPCRRGAGAGRTARPAGHGRPCRRRRPRGARRRARFRHPVGRQRLPRRVGHRRLPQERRRRRRHRPGHRRIGHRRPCRRPLRLGSRRLRPTRGCGGRGPRHRMRGAGDGRQLRVLHRGARSDVCRLPAGRDLRQRRRR